MAAKTATNNGTPQSPQYHWDDLTQADTAVEAYWPGGEGYFEVAGTFGSATVLFKFSSISGGGYELDSEASPDGGTFTAPGVVKFDLPKGYIQPTFSGGSSQNIDIKVTPKRG